MLESSIKIQMSLKTTTGATLLKESSLVITKGRILGLIGESGAGKTIVGKCLAGVLPQTIVGVKSPRDSVKFTMLPQLAQVSLPPLLSVQKFLSFVLRWNNNSSSEVSHDALIRTSLRKVNIEQIDAVMQLKPHELSGGLAQRIAFAAALLTKPNVLVLDEPTASLDPISSLAVANLILDLSRRELFSTVLITHDIPLVKMICDECSIIVNQSIGDVTPMNDILHSNDPYIKALIPADVPPLTLEGALLGGDNKGWDVHFVKS